jgi:hypothetical protein
LLQDVFRLFKLPSVRLARSTIKVPKMGLEIDSSGVDHLGELGIGTRIPAQEFAADSRNLRIQFSYRNRFGNEIRPEHDVRIEREQPTALGRSSGLVLGYREADVAVVVDDLDSSPALCE